MTAKRLLVMALFFASLPVCGAPISADDILAALGRPDHLTADYALEKKTPAVSARLASKGRLVINKDLGLLWITTEPFEDAIGFSKNKTGAMDDNGHWTVKESRAAKRALEITRQFLDADPDEVSNHFFLTPSGTPSHWELVVTPKGGSAAQFISEMLISGDEHIKRLQIVQTDGTITRIEFTNVNPAPTISADDLRLLEAMK